MAIFLDATGIVKQDPVAIRLGREEREAIRRQEYISRLRSLADCMAGCQWMHGVADLLEKDGGVQ